MTQTSGFNFCDGVQNKIRLIKRKDLAMYDELIIEEIRRQEREMEEDRRLYLELPPPPPPTKKKQEREPKRVIEIEL